MRSALLSQQAFDGGQRGLCNLGILRGLHAGNTNATELLSAEEDRYAAFHGHTIHAEESGAISDHRFNQLGGHADQGGGLRLSDGGGDRGGGRFFHCSQRGEEGGGDGGGRGGG